MSGGRKRTNPVILAICFIMIVIGVVGIIFTANMGEDQLFLNQPKGTWSTVSLSCLNAGWIGALILYWAGRRR